MPIYEYLCTNEGCPSVEEERPRFEERHCSIEEGKILPTCEECGKAMPRAYLEMPSVSWKYISANGNMARSFMGPDQRSVRRHAGWKNGIRQFKPVYEEGKKHVGRRELKVTPQGSLTGDEGGDT
jgi:hypothetical protein